MNISKFAGALALALGASFGAQATTTAVTQTEQWYQFAVDDFTAVSQGTEWIDLDNGSAQSFSFVLNSATYLRVVDAGYAGDRFNVSIDNGSGASILQTGAAVNSHPAQTGDYAAAWADSNYSRLATLLAPGTYTVTGSLLAAAGGGAPLNATAGALMLTAVPEPESWALLVAGFALIGSIARRRRA